MQVTNMLKTIDGYAQTQPDMAVYNVLGETHSYADLKRDSDGLAAYVDSLDLPDKSLVLSLIHISEPTRRTPISYAVFCLKKKRKQNYRNTKKGKKSERNNLK